MIFLKKFTLMDEDQTYSNGWSKIVGSETDDESYPLGIFQFKLSEVVFDDITIIYGGNGSGKSTLLNLIGETLEIQRSEPYNRTKMFDFFVRNSSFQINSKGRNSLLEKYRADQIPPKSKYIASDDIFKHIQSVRANNIEIKERKDKEDLYHRQVNGSSYSDYFNGGVSLDMEDKASIDAFKKYVDARSKTGRQFVKSRAGEMEHQFSNGENALMYFDKQIEDNTLYLLDEPENSMSPQFQLQLKTLIEDSVRYKNCQFVIATHSPFILALQHAKIYNLDAQPSSIEKWYNLENMRIYYDFFQLYQLNFEQ